MQHSERYKEYLRNGYLWDGANPWFVLILVVGMCLVAYAGWGYVEDWWQAWIG